MRPGTRGELKDNGKDNMMAYIEFQNLSKYYGSKQVLDDINLSIGKGELVTLLGPSGCGKSTLLRCLAGLEEVTEGRILLDGTDITGVEPRKRDIGMVFQQYSLFPNMTVTRNVAFGLKIKKTDKALIREKTADILKIVGLDEQAGMYPAQLSGGQQQRAALARALVTEPKVLLLDEPLSAIDALLRHSLQIEIRRIQKEVGITAVFVTHDQDEAMVMSDTIHLLHDGRIEQSARPIDMYTKPVTRFAATFIGHYNLLSAAQLKTACGGTAFAEMTAFRPEIIDMHPAGGAEPENPDAYLMRGRIAASLPHGNIIRYAVLCGGVQIDVDTLFGDESLFHEGDEVCLAVPKDKCISL